MLPALANRHQPALAVMQSITAGMARLHREEAAPQFGLQQPTVSTASRPRDMQAINDYYFGHHLTITEVMVSMMERVVGHLNDKLALGRDGDPEGVEAGTKWREKALVDEIGIGSPEDFTIPAPGRDGVTFRDVSRLIQERFNADYLSQDREMVRMLEDMLGFRLGTVSVADLLEAFVDPASDASAKVRETISEGLAGQAGSKASQRLEEAAEGPKTVAETIEATKHTEGEEVDEKTLAEDLEAVENAKAREKLESTAEARERIAEKVAVAREKGAGDPSAATDLALGIIQNLAAGTPVQASDEGEPAATDDGEARAGAARPADTGARTQEAGEDRETSLRAAIERAYRETLLDQDEDDRRPFAVWM